MPETHFIPKSIATYMLAASLCTGAFAFAAIAPPTNSVSLDQGTGSVEFRATGHPSAIKIIGKGGSPKGTIRVSGKNVSGNIHFALASLDTGIEMRNHHMKEKYLEVEKFPEALLIISSMALPNELDHDGGFDQVPFTGKLSLHGVERPVTGTANVKRQGDEVSFEANFGLRVADYAIALPTFAGFTMADEVQIGVLSTAPVKAEKNVSSN